MVYLAFLARASSNRIVEPINIINGL